MVSTVVDAAVLRTVRAAVRDSGEGCFEPQCATKPPSATKEAPVQ